MRKYDNPFTFGRLLVVGAGLSVVLIAPLAILRGWTVLEVLGRIFGF